ncbi:hypothetical protein E2C01_014788 [Portunus trituberculatus]|uniref:Uncharacterized protein n=1 Tax=Portunus trituberculatus TaxID=210409 RepID=A0A5B7DJQ1_PORTR|nr:hypothetical protein [Portunus trituberculatus]
MTSTSATGGTGGDKDNGGGSKDESGRGKRVPKLTIPGGKLEENTERGDIGRGRTTAGQRGREAAVVKRFARFSASLADAFADNVLT